MKKTFYFLLIASIIFNKLDAQCWNNVNTISTDWRITNPINRFNWTAETYDSFYITKYAIGSTVPPTPLVLPMWAPSPSVSRNSNLDHFQQVIAGSDKDFWPEDGWELLIKDFGEPGGISKATDNPFYALYNKYTGKLRVFYLATEKPSDKKANSAAILIKFSEGNRKTALFQNLNPISIPLISFNPVYNFTTPNYYATEDLYWLFCEVDIAYDPCTCHLTEDSKIQIEAHIITTSAINATINGLLDQKVTEAGTNGSGTPSTSKSIFTIGKYDIPTGVKKGQKAYKEWEGYQKEAVKFLQQQDTAFQKKFKKEIFYDYDGWIIGDSVYKDFDKAKLDPDFWKAVFTMLPTQDSKPFKELAKVLPYVGVAISLVDFFSSGGATDNTAKSATTPISFQANLVLKGSISTNSINSTKTFFTPGSKTGGLNFIPTYNNILGVFNVLNVPPMEYAEYQPFYNVPSWDQNISPTIPKIRQYRLSEPLEYVVNPAANVDVESIMASYIMEFDTSIVFSGITSPCEDIDQMPVEFGKIGLSTKDNSTDSLLAINIVKRIENTGLQLDYEDSAFQFNQSNGLFTGGTIRFRTPYVPLECFQKQAFSLFYRNFTSAVFRNKPPRIFIKLHIKLNRKDANGDPIVFIRSFQIPELSNSISSGFTGGKYKIKKHFLNSNPPNTAWNNYATGFVGAPFFVSSINAKDTLIFKSGDIIDKDVYAKKYIQIDSGTLILSGVRIMAGNSVEVGGGVEIPPGVEIFNTTNPSLCNDLGNIANFHLTDAEINTICNSQIYRDNALSGIAPIFDSSQNNTNNLNVNVYPNPNNGAFIILLESKNNNNSFNIKLTDITGRVVWEKEEKPEIQKILINKQDLTNGIYFLNILSGKNQYSNKILIQN